MPSLTILGVCGLCVAVVIQGFLFLRARHRQQQTASDAGCRPPARGDHSDLFGLVNTVRMMRAYRAERLLEYFREKFNEISKKENYTVLTYETQILGDKVFFTYDPKNIQAILATQFKDFELGNIRNNLFSNLLGHGIFSSDGKQWEHSRALLRPNFARDQVSNLDLEEEHLQNMLKAMPVHSSGWTEFVNVQPLLFRLTIDSATEFLFGESVNSQRNALSQERTSKSLEDATFVASFESALYGISNAMLFNEWYNLALGKDFYAACKRCHSYIDRYVAKALSQEKRHNKSNDENGRYVFLEQLAAQTSDPVEIRDQVLSILVAGRDTTASLMSFLLLMLAAHPGVLDKLRQIVLREFGTFQNPRNITFASLKSCSYLQWCLNETLRLFPTVPMNGRRSTKDTTLPRGGGEDGRSPIFIPKDTEVNYLVYVTHRDTGIWGSDSNSFIPERWENRKYGFDYLPFNAGPRVCLGQQFALTEAGYVAVRLLQRFDRLEALESIGTDVAWNLTLTGRPRDGVKLRLRISAEA